MRSPTDAAVALSLRESLSLLYVGTKPVADDLPEDHAAKLTSMGLAEIEDGRITFTHLGRRVADGFATIAEQTSSYIH